MFIGICYCYKCNKFELVNFDGFTSGNFNCISTNDLTYSRHCINMTSIRDLDTEYISYDYYLNRYTSFSKETIRFIDKERKFLNDWLYHVRNTYIKA